MRATRRGVLAAALGGALAAGCASSSGLRSGAYTTVGTFNITLPREWSDITFMLPNRPRHMRLLSIDGPLLNRLYLASLEPGESRPRRRGAAARQRSTADRAQLWSATRLEPANVQQAQRGDDTNQMMVRSSREDDHPSPTPSCSVLRAPCSP